MPTRPTSRLASALVAGIVVLTAAVALIAPSTASASACGDKVLNDWWDNNRIDRVYPVQCYRDAIDSIPADLRDYANVEEVITRALNQVLNGDGPSGPSDPDEPGASETPPVDRTADPSPGGEDPAEVLDNVDSSSPSSIPVPLLLLAAMSILLLGAGGLGYLSRRRNAEALDETPPDDDIV
jgi:hypothetical protein